MPSAMNPFPVVRCLAFRSRPNTALRPVIGVKRPACRTYADESSKAMPEAQDGAVGPNMQQQEHVSEEAAKMNKIMGGEGPDIEGHGTPVQEACRVYPLGCGRGTNTSQILQHDKEARKNAPEVMKDSMKTGQGAQNAKPSTTTSGTRSFSTLARRRADMDMSSASASSLDPSMIPSESQRAAYAAEQHPLASQEMQEEKKGHKFPLPALPLPQGSHKDYRYDPVVQQVTNLIMRDGKKATAQRNMSVILSTLRTAPPPAYSAERPLLPGAPPASHLPLHPVLYLTLAIDSVAPLLRIRSQRGAAGGGVALQIPVPLGLRQRRRTAFMWILDAASKRRSRGSGKDQFASRVAEELISVVEGRSAIWEKRGAVHRLGTTARSNLTHGARGRR